MYYRITGKRHPGFGDYLTTVHYNDVEKIVSDLFERGYKGVEVEEAWTTHS